MRLGPQPHQADGVAMRLVAGLPGSRRVAGSAAGDGGASDLSAAPAVGIGYRWTIHDWARGFWMERQYRSMSRWMQKITVPMW